MLADHAPRNCCFAQSASASLVTFHRDARRPTVTPFRLLEQG
jgi:hypothetical protein